MSIEVSQESNIVRRYLRDYRPGPMVNDGSICEDAASTADTCTSTSNHRTRTDEIRLDDVTPTTRMGIWQCPIGQFNPTFGRRGGVFLSILHGRAQLTSLTTGTSMSLQQNEGIYCFHDNLEWNILQDLTAVFYECNTPVSNPMEQEASTTTEATVSFLQKYSRNTVLLLGEMEHWPFTNPQSKYVIHHGSTPSASGRIDQTTPNTRVGIWHCTIGTMECTEQGDELMTILTGKVTVTDTCTGQSLLLEAGDSMFSYNGKRVIWDVHEDVTKVFFGSKEGGYS